MFFPEQNGSTNDLLGKKNAGVLIFFFLLFVAKAVLSDLSIFINKVAAVLLGNETLVQVQVCQTRR